MRSLRQLYNPALFQGSLKKNNYFEGWYFKHVSADTGNAFAVIPGISLSDDAHSFIQYIDGNTGKTSYFRYMPEEINFNDKKFEIHIGQSFFSDKEIQLNLENDEHHITGNIRYSDINYLPKHILRPGIMGWYSFVPGMECNHGVLSTGHDLEGEINVNGQSTEYSGGRGYIEKDWGISFPESWIWMQCNNFSDADVSVMISVAKIPWRGSWFIGFISFLRIEKRTEIFATYKGAKIIRLKRIDDTSTEIILSKDPLLLTAIVTKKGSGTLKAPSMGLMDSIIKESLNSEVALEFRSAKKILFSGKGLRAGYEETEKIFDYFIHHDRHSHDPT